MSAGDDVGCGLISLADVLDAAATIGGKVHRTPILTCEALDALASAACGRAVQLLFKCENFQKTGSFKARGALNAVSKLSEEERRRGVCTHSSGNHAQALAFAAHSAGVPAYVVMPSTAAAVKRRAVVDTYGGQVIDCGPLPADRERVCSELIAERGLPFVHPANDLRVIAGQATVALEILDELGEARAPDVVVVPVGGGGLASGTAVTVKSMRPGTAVVGAEPLGADDAKRSLDAGAIVPQTDPRTVADGLRTSIYNNTFALLRRNVDRILLADEPAIYAATRLVWERMKIIAEPSSAITLAVVLSPEFAAFVAGRQLDSARPLRVALILSGGNVDLAAFSFPPT